MTKLEEHHEVLVKTFKDKHGNKLISTLAKIKDLEAFIKQIAEIRGIKKPILILAADGNTNQCVISGIIREEGEDDMEDGESEYNFNGVKRVLMLAKVDGIPETYANVKILLDSLDLPKLSKSF